MVGLGLGLLVAGTLAGNETHRIDTSYNFNGPEGTEDAE